MDLSRRFPFFHIAHMLPSPTRILRRAMCLLNSVLVTKRPAALINARRSQIEFDIDLHTGFLPRTPLPLLDGDYYIWERAFSEAADCVKLAEDCTGERGSTRCGEVWRSAILSWPILDIGGLMGDRRRLQRAHLVLSWLTQYYVHSLPHTGLPEPKRVPAQIAVPLVAVSKALGIAPVITYADTILWNWELIRPDHPVTFDNMLIKHSFSDTDDEKAFYMVQAFIELHGVQALRIMDDYMKISDFDNLPVATISRLARDLIRLATIIGEISDLIQDVRRQCDPHVFYWDVRPWLDGSDSKGPTEPGWIYEGTEDGENLELSGPSGGQSTVMHALDVFLDIDHRLRHKRSPAPSEENKRADKGFMDRMRHYMPGKHRQFLEYLDRMPRSIRELAETTPALREPYNSAVMAMKKLRDLHIRIVCLYIINMSKTPRPGHGCPAQAMLKNLEEDQQAAREPIRGTGGTSLVALLKAGRDATTRARV